MTRWSVVWLCWLLAFLVIEVAAWRTGNYWNTLSGVTVRAMLTHPFVAVVVVAVLAGVLFHLCADYVVLRVRP